LRNRNRERLLPAGGCGKMRFYSPQADNIGEAKNSGRIAERMITGWKNG
jgi:hypothetical protein